MSRGATALPILRVVLGSRGPADQQSTNRQKDIGKPLSERCHVQWVIMRFALTERCCCDRSDSISCHAGDVSELHFHPPHTSFPWCSSPSFKERGRPTRTARSLHRYSSIPASTLLVNIRLHCQSGPSPSRGRKRYVLHCKMHICRIRGDYEIFGKKSCNGLLNFPKPRSPRPHPIPWGGALIPHTLPSLPLALRWC